jgi:ABC-2 type transport system permease protein
MGLDATRVSAVIRKELTDYRRKRSIVVTMIVMPLLFLVEPIVSIFVDPPTEAPPAMDKFVVLPLLYMLLIAVVTPSTLAAFTVVGEREQGTLEPLLTTPIRKQEFILGKAAAVMIPTLGISYLVFGFFLAFVRVVANPAIATGIFDEGPLLLALFLFTPLLAGWAIVVGLAVSVRAGEVRVAQQLGMIASFPPLGVVVLLVLGVIAPTFSSAIGFAALLLAIDLLALRAISGMFDRERLVTGTRASRF